MMRRPLLTSGKVFRSSVKGTFILALDLIWTCALLQTPPVTALVTKLLSFFISFTVYLVPCAVPGLLALPSESLVGPASVVRKSLLQGRRPNAEDVACQHEYFPGDVSGTP
jgi:hypothetical protein